MPEQMEIQRYLENVSTNPRWGQDPSKIEFPVFYPNNSSDDSESFLITSRVIRNDDPESLYYNLIFRDSSLKEMRLQLTPIVSIKRGYLKVCANGEITILNENFETSVKEILPVHDDGLSEWLAYFRIQYRMQKFTDAEFKFVGGELIFTDSFEVSFRQAAERSVCAIS